MDNVFGDSSVRQSSGYWHSWWASCSTAPRCGACTRFCWIRTCRCKGALAIRHGYSKQHRPDLKQFGIGLLSTSEGVSYRATVHDGNLDDKTWCHDRRCLALAIGTSNRKCLGGEGGRWLLTPICNRLSSGVLNFRWPVRTALARRRSRTGTGGARWQGGRFTAFRSATGGPAPRRRVPGRWWVRICSLVSTEHGGHPPLAITTHRLRFQV